MRSADQTLPGECIGIRLRVMMIGATGAVGQQVVATLRNHRAVEQLTLLGRRPLPHMDDPAMVQHGVDVLDPQTYRHLLGGHQAAVCTLGVGQPSAVSEAEFVRVDKDAVIAFAIAGKNAGVTHFELLGAVAADAGSRSLYLRTKGELRDALVALGFARLSIFAPSMILTPTNRYGFGQWLMLALWPKLNFILRGAWTQYRGIAVETLGAAMAAKLLTRGTGVEHLYRQDFVALAAPRNVHQIALPQSRS